MKPHRSVVACEAAHPNQDRHDIEVEVGVPVFDRTTDCVRLTRQGVERVSVALLRSHQLDQDYAQKGSGASAGIGH